MVKSSFKRYLFLVPALLFVALFIYLLGYELILSFKDVTLITYINKSAGFIGLTNYRNLLHDGTFLHVIVNSLVFTGLSMLFQFIIGFLIAVLFNRDFPLKGIFISLIMLPWFIPILVSGNIFKFFFNDTGFINGVLLSIGLIHRPISWLTSGSAIYTATLVNIWLGIPFNFILLYTGMKSIPTELYEAADIDGATGRQKAFYITLPMLKSVVMTTLMFGFISTMQVFDLIWVLTGGGPANLSQIFGTYSYYQAFTNFNFGQASAISMFLFLLVMIVTIILMFVQSKKIKPGEMQ